MVNSNQIAVINRLVLKGTSFREAHCMVFGDTPDWDNLDLVCEILKHKNTWNAVIVEISNELINLRGRK